MYHSPESHPTWNVEQKDPYLSRKSNKPIENYQTSNNLCTQFQKTGCIRRIFSHTFHFSLCSFLRFSSPILAHGAAACARLIQENHWRFTDQRHCHREFALVSCGQKELEILDKWKESQIWRFFALVFVGRGEEWGCCDQENCSECFSQLISFKKVEMEMKFCDSIKSWKAKGPF